MKLIRVTLATASSLLLTAALAGCAGSSDDPSATDRPDRTTFQQGGPGAAPGASGRIAAISGKTLQVQNEQTGQVAVSWTAKTDVREQVDGSLDDVTVGACVAVTTGDDDVATTVRIIESCGPAPTDRPSDLPTDRPSDMPTDMPQRQGTFGEVTAVSVDGFTVGSTDVTVSADTTYTTTVAADSSALKVGRCVMATGDADGTGAVVAEQISVSDPVDGECQAGFMTRQEPPQ